MGTLFGEHSQTSSLIDQRCHPMIIISKCVSTHSVCGCRPTLPSALAYTRTHTLSRSLSLRMFVLFPFDIKTHLPQMLIIIEIQDSVVFGCSHFIGSTNTKVHWIHFNGNMNSTTFDQKHSVKSKIWPTFLLLLQPEQSQYTEWNMHKVPVEASCKIKYNCC